MSAAARNDEPHFCPAHGESPLFTLSDGHVRTNSRAQARGSDRAECKGPPDFIVTGSGTVAINSRPAARQADKTMHQGMIIIGSGNVFIGGPTVGVTLGNPGAGKNACAAAAAGRAPPPGTKYPPGHPREGQQIAGHTTQQSYNNCGIESSRIIINQATGKKLSEDELYDWAVDHNDSDASKKLRKRYHGGGVYDWQMQDILKQHGVEATQERQTMDTLAQAVAEGKGVITSHRADILWDRKDQQGAHAIGITGMVYGPDGQLVGVITLDTGLGDCAAAIPADRFKRSLLDWPSHAVITKKPIW
jgi:uncharacterized Zn-binding protein involved in type VI secretion